MINKELEDVAEWYTLGINLGFPKHVLDMIQHDVGSEGAIQCRLATLTQWYNNCPDVSWPDLIRALMLMGRRRLAHKLALKYRESLARQLNILYMMYILATVMTHIAVIPGVPVPPVLVKTPPTTVVSASAEEPSSATLVQEELLGKIDVLTKKLEEKDSELEQKEKLIKKSISRKRTLTKERDKMVWELELNNRKNLQLEQERHHLEQELKSQNVELKLLEGAQHDTKWQSEIHHLQEMIEEKKKKIEMLKDQLSSVKHLLDSERAMTLELRNKVDSLESELREKITEAHSHEMEVVKMQSELKVQRYELEQLNQLQAANSTQKEHIQEIQVFV